MATSENSAKGKRNSDQFCCKRGSGVLLHISSLPGRFGIGDFGRSSSDFLDFLKKAEQQYWQILPLVPTCSVFGHSPYASFSAFAGNPLFIDPEQLVESGYLAPGDLNVLPVFSEYVVDHDTVSAFKKALFRKAFSAFRQQRNKDDFIYFKEQSPWINTYSLFMAAREIFGNTPWYEWPEKLRNRDPEALKNFAHEREESIGYFEFEQYCFFTQLQRLRIAAQERGIQLIGDIPIYVSHDSADVWGMPQSFFLDEHGLPLYVAGVPPDYFSETGQRWGNPLYRWKTESGEKREALYQWWVDRFQRTFAMVDIVRLDHFRGFESYWEVPATEKTAENGRWVKGPGKAFFQHMKKELGVLPIIAEDLGIITPAVEKLRSDLGFPGMKILQFAFDSDAANLYLPHNYSSSNYIVYTGTHDNDTVVGWYLSPEVAETSKQRARRYANHPDSQEIHWDFIRMAFSSTASVAISPLQDILGFGSDCRMNMPSTINGNWRWRCAARFLTESVQRKLADETRFYGRTP